MESGWSAVDCGCGPIGALTVLADLVGPSGRVAGIDFNAPSIERAKSVLHALGIGNVQVYVRDVSVVNADEIGGPFDLAYTRCFLMHQPDPVATLQAIARLVRPGGYVVAHEPLREPPPRSEPQVDELRAYWEMAHEANVRNGVPHRPIDGLPAAARRLGYEVVDMRGSFGVMDSELGFGLHAATVAAAKDRAVASSVVTEEEVDRMTAALRSAAAGGYSWVSTPTYLELTFRLPN
jgi:SAM-dependent methyltransferase